MGQNKGIHKDTMRKFVDNVLHIKSDVSMKAVCIFCNTKIPVLCNNKKRCVLHMLGICKKAACNRVHGTATNKEAAHILALLEKAIQNLEDLKATQGKY
eukprot:15347657-Ditylum_brightwellii.AAC.1